MLQIHLCLAALLASVATQSHADTQSATDQITSNPIRKVVTMLQNMQKKVEEEGEMQKKLFDKFMCHCKSSGGNLQASIEAAESKVPQLTSEIKSAGEQKMQLQEDVTQHKADRAAAEDAMKKAAAVRDKEAAAFKAYTKEAGINMEAVNKAVAALVKGMGKSFLQSDAAQLVQQVAVSSRDLSEEDRRDVLAFFASSSKYGYSPSGGEIVGILKEMATSLDKAIGEAARTEAASSKSYEELMRAKKKEIESLNESIRTKTQRGSEIALKLVEMQEDLDDTEKALVQDKKLLSQTEKGCSTRDEEYKKESATRQQEILAIADTIKILNSDDARELLTKALPAESSSFLQMTLTAAKIRKEVASILQKARAVQLGDHSQLDLILLALRGKKIGFDAIVSKIDTLLAELKKEQDDDTKKKVYCLAELDKTEDKSKTFEREITDTGAEIDSEKEDLASLADDLARLSEHIKNLDKDVAEATEQRKEEHKEYLEQLAANTAAKQLLEFAKERLQKFYGAALSQITAGDDLGEEKSYKKKSDESRGVIGMINTLIHDIETDMAEAKAEEDDAQADYQTTMQEAKEKRTSDSKSLMSKEKTKASTKSELNENKSEKKDLTKDLMTNEAYLASIHKACDWLLQNFDTRKAARSAEIENLKNAKMVLAGVDASLLEVNSQQFLGRQL